MNWIWLIVIAQFLNAIVALVDKFIITSKKVSKPYVYTFYTCILSALSILIFTLSGIPIPFADVVIPSIADVGYPSVALIILSLISATTFFVALNAMFISLSDNDASDVVPVIGAVSAVSTFFLGAYFIGGEITSKSLLGFVFLVIGTLIVSHFRFDLKTFFLTLFAGLFFGFHTIIIKLIFFETNYSNGFFWSRLAMVIVALATLVWPDFRKRIFKKGQRTTKSGNLWILGNKTIAGIVAIIMFKAIELGDVAVVQALGGLQFLFILLIAFAIHPHIKRHVGEKHVTLQAVLQKTIAVLLISAGFWALF